jgi:hypothetical protein
MKIYDKNNVQITNPDLALGHLVEDRIFIAHHEAVQAVAEEGHWETVAVYPNGGKDASWIVDVPAVEAKEAWDEYEDILRYIPLTEEELEQIEEAKNKPTAEQRIAELEEALNALLEGLV